MSGGIRVKAGVKTVPVNDAGQTITLNFSDQGFPGRVFTMMDRIGELAERARDQEADIRKGTAEGSLEQTRALCECNEKLHREMMAQVDGAFGPDTCRKVFGDIVPGVEMFQEFFEQLIPYFEEYGRERAQRLSRYSPARSGNV